MRTSLLLLFAVGCAADPVEVTVQTLDNSKVVKVGVAQERPTTVCYQAAQLPADDVCSQICDPDALIAQLRANGESPGSCVEFRCDLPDTSSVVVGVCLPPN